MIVFGSQCGARSGGLPSRVGTYFRLAQVISGSGVGRNANASCRWMLSSRFFGFQRPKLFVRSSIKLNCASEASVKHGNPSAGNCAFWPIQPKNSKLSPKHLPVLFFGNSKRSCASAIAYFRGKEVTVSSLARLPVEQILFINEQDIKMQCFSLVLRGGERCKISL